VEGNVEGGGGEGYYRGGLVHSGRCMSVWSGDEGRRLPAAIDPWHKKVG
jgi:hypothetical protein